MNRNTYIDMTTDKFKGCLIGGASGDALGYTVEFLENEQIRSLYGEKGIIEYTLTDNAALVSDDNQMTLFTANGLLRGIIEHVSDLYTTSWEKNIVNT